jgi:hypothetical protein
MALTIMPRDALPQFWQAQRIGIAETLMNQCVGRSLPHLRRRGRRRLSNLQMNDASWQISVTLKSRSLAHDVHREEWRNAAPL